MDSIKEKGSPFYFQLSAPDCLALRVGRLMEDIEGKPFLNGEDFREYGVMRDGKFIPFLRKGERFEEFTQREAGLNRTVAEVVNEVAQRIFIESKIPMNKESRDKLSTLADLFNPGDLDRLQAYALLVEDEMAHHLALALEQTAQIDKGIVEKVVSPLDQLREEADIEMLKFGSEVKTMADAVYGSPEYYPDPEDSSETVTQFKEREILSQEPKIVGLAKLNHSVYGITVKGESTRHSDDITVKDVEGSVDLVVLSETKNQRLTQILLGMPAFLRYLLGSSMVKIQREKMKKLKYIFTTVRAREAYDEVNNPWPFEFPAKKPSSV